MQNKSVLISGASVAGPTLAFWLDRHGFETTVVERAPTLREGGQAVDFRGEAHLGVLRRMGILDAVVAHQTNMGEQIFVDARGQTLVTLPAEFMSGEVEIHRGDLSRILHEATRGTTEYRFGDCITSLVETRRGVEVEFERGPSRTFDLVVGADGLHSGVRALAFGDESQFVRFLGHYVAGFTLPNVLGLRKRGLIYSEPGRGVCVSNAREDDEARALFVLASPPIAYDRRDIEAQKRIVTDAFSTMGWEVPRVLDALPSSKDLYFDAVASVDMRRVSEGRVALVGDAAFGGTLGGQGTGAALIGAYVLAGELAAARGDHVIAFARYETRIRDYAARCQKGASHAGPFFAPATPAKLWLRNKMYGALSSPGLRWVLHKLVTSAASGIELADYAA
jgi:2-polyprenyl-6-methoxyphenol hydroxylase-like FAD-dependent oxidoreductase